MTRPKDPALRRACILAVLMGEISQGEAERLMEWSKGMMSGTMKTERERDQRQMLKAAEEEVAFRRRMVELEDVREKQNDVKG